MPTYKVRHQGKIKEVDYAGLSPTKDELRHALEIRPSLDYNLPEPAKPPSPKKFEPKDWLDILDPHARETERVDRNMFTVDLSKATNKAVDKISQSGDDANANKWKAQKLGFVSGAGEAALNMLGAPENVLMGAPRIFRQRMADYPGHSINPRTSAELVPVGGEEAYNQSFPKTQGSEQAPINYMERYERARARPNTTTPDVRPGLLEDETGAIGKNIRKGHITGKFLKKEQPVEADWFDRQMNVPSEPIDIMKQMQDTLKLADAEKKLKGLSPTEGRKFLKDLIREEKKSSEIGPVYHGTPNLKGIQESGFDVSKGSGTTLPNYIHFADDPNRASRLISRVNRAEDMPSGSGVVPAKLNVKSPLDLVDMKPSQISKLREIVDDKKDFDHLFSVYHGKIPDYHILDWLKKVEPSKLKSIGFDSIRYTERNPLSDETFTNWAVPHGTDIKTPAGVKLHGLSGKK